MSGLDEKAVLAACEAYHADIPTHDPPSRWAMEQAISAYLAAATPADVGEEPVARYRKLERELSNTKNTDLRADIKDDIIGLSAELATALERVTRERDEARATLDEVCLSSRQEWQRATSAEAKLAEAREHSRKQAEDIMTLGQLVYADADTTWKDRAATLRARLETVEADRAAQAERMARLEDAVNFVARWAWRTDPPNANNKLSDTERLSCIKHYPTIEEAAKPHIELAEAEAARALSQEGSDA